MTVEQIRNIYTANLLSQLRRVPFVPTALVTNIFRPSKYLTSFATEERRKIYRSSCNPDVTNDVNNNLHETLALLGPVVKGQA